MMVMLIGLKIIQEAERHSLVAFMMRDGGKCAVGYISRSLHWSNSLCLSCGGQARFIPRPPLIASARSVRRPPSLGSEEQREVQKSSLTRRYGKN